MNRWPLLLLLICLCGCGCLGSRPATRSKIPAPALAKVLANDPATRRLAVGNVSVGGSNDRARLTIAVDLPSEVTPFYVHWALWTNQYYQVIWTPTGSRGSQFCRDVTLTWTAVPGKFYAIEQSHFPVVDGLRGSGKWQKVSPSGTQLFWSSDTGTIIVRFGSPYAWNFFRVIEQ